MTRLSTLSAFTAPTGALAKLIPGVALVPCMGTAQWSVFLTGGQPAPRRWILGKLDGAGLFESLDEAIQGAEAAGGTLQRRADHLVFVARGGLFDPQAKEAA